ncbi:unnamed protein product, partial [marine sediment metagenome]
MTGHVGAGDADLVLPGSKRRGSVSIIVAAAGIVFA